MNCDIFFCRHHDLMYGKFKNNKVKSAEEEKQAKLDRVNQMKKIYLQPRTGSRKTSGFVDYM